MINFWLKYERFAEEHPLAFSLLHSACVICLVIAIFQPAFQTNDDPVMNMIASGRGISTAPDEHLVFTNVAIGLVLKQLYQAIPNFPWYASYLFFVHFVSQAALLYSIVSWRFSRTSYRLYLIYFGVVGLYLLCNLQFTTTSFLAVQCGTVLCLTTLWRRGAEPGFRVTPSLIAGGALIVLSALVRIDSFYAALAAAGPVVAITLWRNRRRDVWRPALLCGLAVVALAFGFQHWNRTYYAADPNWSKFYEYNGLRVKFNDYQWTSYTRETRPVFDSVNWSENDYAMLANWFFEDAELYSAPKLRQVLSSFPWLAHVSTLNRVAEAFKGIFRDHFLMPIWLTLPLLFWCARDRKLATWVVLATAFTIGAIFIYLTLYAKAPPSRVYYPLLSFPVLLLLMLARLGAERSRFQNITWFSFRTGYQDLAGADRREAQLTFKFSGSLALAIVLLAAGISVSQNGYRLYRHGREALRASRSLRTALATLNPRDDELYVCWGANFPFEAIMPTENPSRLASLHLLVLGWPQHTAFHQAMKERFKIDDVAQALYDQPKVYLVSNDLLNTLYTKYAKEHHDVNVSCNMCFNTRQFSIYKPRPLVFSLEDGSALETPPTEIADRDKSTKLR